MTTCCLINVSLSEENMDPCAASCRETQGGGGYVCGCLPGTRVQSFWSFLSLTLTSQCKSSSGIIHVSTNRAEALIKCMLPFMLSTSLTQSRHSRVGRSIASATTVSSEQHFHSIGMAIKAI